MSQPPDHVSLNRAYWDAQAAEYYVEAGRRSWASQEPGWGIWSVPDSRWPCEEIWKPRKR